jgi:adenosylcobinamide-GDP ribazoletransferase
MRDALGLLTTFGRRHGGGRIHARSLPWFPLVGAALGAVVGAAWWGAQQWWPRPVAAGLVLLVDACCTGLLHFDGLADAADGLLPHAPPERRLAIMRTPDVGAFGVLTVAIVVVLQAAALASRPANVLLIAALWCAARALVAAVPAVVPYARDHGIASPLLAGAQVWPAVAIIPAVGLGALGAGVAGGAAIVAASLAGGATIAFAVRRIGGFTGDVLGAAIVLAETAGLVVAAARW